MAIADPLSRLSRQEHRVDNLDLPLLLEILFMGLPEEIKNLGAFQRKCGKGYQRCNENSSALENEVQPYPQHNWWIGED